MFATETVKRIRALSTEAEQRGELSSDVLEIIYGKRLFKLFVPAELEGRMTDLPEALRIFEEASWIDGSFGWLITIGSGGGFFADFFDPEVLPHVFGAPDAVIAGSAFPGGVATPVEGGFRVSGEWKYCSGALHATLFTANARISREDEEGRLLAFAFRPDQVTVIRDWNTMGLRATGSHSIKVMDTFVPTEMTFDLTQPHDTYSHPLYRYPFVPFAESSFASVVLGIGKHFLDEAERLIKRRQANSVPPGASEQPTECALAALQYTREAIEQTRTDFYQRVELSWEQCVQDGDVSESAQEAVGRLSRATAAIVTERVDTLIPYLGMEAVKADSPINQVWRDLRTARQHAFLSPQ